MILSRKSESGQSSQNAVALSLGAFLAGAGVLHFVMPRPYDRMIPKWLPGAPRTWTYGSGVAELVLASAVVVRPSRRRGALTTAALFAAVFPGNIQMALDARRHNRTKVMQVGTIARLPLQAPLILWALRVARRA